jgi:hypothetical protein
MVCFDGFEQEPNALILFETLKIVLTKTLATMQGNNSLPCGSKDTEND